MKALLLPTLAALAATVLAGPAAAVETLRLTTQEFPPYQSKETGTLNGIAVDVVTCTLQRMGQRFEIELLPWARAQKLVEDGEAHGFFSASRSAARDAYARMSELVAPQVWQWYMPKGSTTDPAAKATLKVGTMMGSAMQTWLEENGYNVALKGRSVELLIKNLEARRIDVFLANELAFEKEAADLGRKRDDFTVVTHSDRPLGVYFGKKFLDQEPAFLDRFNAEIAPCRAKS